MESYRVEAQATMEIALEDSDGTVEPPPESDPGFKSDPELDRLSNILQNFNDLFADAGFSEADRIHAMNNINGPIMQSIASDGALAATMASGDEQNSQIQFNSTLAKAWMENIGSNLQVYKKQQQDPLFRQHLEALVYSMYKASQTLGS